MRYGRFLKILRIARFLKILDFARFNTGRRSCVQVTNYWPICIQISFTLHQMSITGNRMVYERDKDIMMLDAELCT